MYAWLTAYEILMGKWETWIVEYYWNYANEPTMVQLFLNHNYKEMRKADFKFQSISNLEPKFNNWIQKVIISHTDPVCKLLISSAVMKFLYIWSKSTDSKQKNYAFGVKESDSGGSTITNAVDLRL